MTYYRFRELMEILFKKSISDDENSTGHRNCAPSPDRGLVAQEGGSIFPKQKKRYESSEKLFHFRLQQHHRNHHKRPGYLVRRPRNVPVNPAKSRRAIRSKTAGQRIMTTIAPNTFTGESRSRKAGTGRIPGNCGQRHRFTLFEKSQKC
jgi:hypothetical protein